jgi:hypothetical protein
LQHACLNTHKQPFSSPTLMFFNRDYLPFVHDDICERAPNFDDVNSHMSSPFPSIH